MFSVEHLMILTVRGRHRKPIIDFPGRHNDVMFEGRGSYTLYILLWNEIKNVHRIQSGPNKDRGCPTVWITTKQIQFLIRDLFQSLSCFQWSHLTTLAKPDFTVHSLVLFVCRLVSAWCIKCWCRWRWHFESSPSVCWCGHRSSGGSERTGEPQHGRLLTMFTQRMCEGKETS